MINKELCMYKNDIEEQMKKYTDKNKYNDFIVMEQLNINAEMLRNMMIEYCVSEELAFAKWDCSEIKENEDDGSFYVTVKPIIDLDKLKESIRYSHTKK